MTNEKILLAFLRSQKCLPDFRKCLAGVSPSNTYAGESGTVVVNRAIMDAFSWTTVIQNGNDWHELHDKWIKLCETFKLTGHIDMLLVAYKRS